MDTGYQVPLCLTVLAGIFLAVGAVCFLYICIDILLRRGWKAMMLVMIPVWPINAAFLGPFTVWLYLRYGRPTKPSPRREHIMHDEEHGAAADAEHHASHGHEHDHHAQHTMETATTSPEKDDHMTHAHMHHASNDRPTWVTVLVGVSHCGAGCVLGDLVGEWLVFGTGAKINGADVWVELLVDYGFALLFGIIFQYFSIAPMSGEWGVRSIVRAIKADFLSLTSFEVGLFGWMVAFEVGIWNYRLMTDTWTYWWMMQVGMILGYVTAIPINWWLISKEIKEPCA